MKLTFFVRIVILLGLSSAVIAAADLSDLYQLALQHNPSYQSKLLQAAQEKTELSRAIGTLLPRIDGIAELSANRNKDLSTGEYTQYDARLEAVQPIIAGPNWSDVTKARLQYQQAEIGEIVAKNELILELAVQFFEVNATRDRLTLAKQRQIAFDNLFEEVNEKFQAGIGTQTDIEEVAAQIDEVRAQLLAAENDHKLANEALAMTVGVDTLPRIASLNAKPNLEDFNNHELTDYESLMQQTSPTIQAASLNSKIARQAVVTQQRAHWPKLETYATLQYEKNDPPGTGHQHTSTIGLRTSLSLFAGGNTELSVKQAKLNYQQQLSRQQSSRLGVSTAVKTEYYNLQNAMAQIQARTLLVSSKQNAANSVRVAYELGERTVKDVLIAETDSLAAKQQLLAAYYALFYANLSLQSAIAPIDESTLISMSHYFN